jgi:hypothetical protein
MHGSELGEKLLRPGDSISLVEREVVNEPDFEGLVRGEHFASRERKFSLAVGNGSLHRGHEPLGRHDAQFGFVQADREIWQHDPVLAAQRQKTPPSWAVTLLTISRSGWKLKFLSWHRYKN